MYVLITLYYSITFRYETLPQIDRSIVRSKYKVSTNEITRELSPARKLEANLAVPSWKKMTVGM